MIAIAALLAERPHPAVCRALALIASNWRDANFTRWLDPQRILAEPWHAGRLACAKARLAAGEQAPTIRVIGYRWNSDWTVYDPSDGIHRTVAAREAGQRTRRSGNAPPATADWPRAIATTGRIVIESDLVRQDDGEPRNFVPDVAPPGAVGSIAITNPPGNQRDAFIARGLQLLDCGVIAGLVLLMRLDHLQDLRAGRRAQSGDLGGPLQPAADLDCRQQRQPALVFALDHLAAG